MRDYVNRLIANGEMQVVRREVNPRGELAAVVAASLRKTDRPILFEQVSGTSMPVVSNLYGSHRRLCDLIGARPGEFCAAWTSLLRKGGPAVLHEGGRQAVEADMVDGELSDLPRIQYFERDAGAYITAGIFLALEPDTGVPNLSFCRSMMIDDSELRVRLAPPHDLARYQAKAEALGSPLEVAILIGPPPEIFLAACASIPYDADELEVAGRLRGGPIPMRQCKTVGLAVPAETEVVIEGRILPNVRRPEAPFGEFLGYYVGEHQSHVFQVTNVSYRRGAIFHALLCGYAEDLRSIEIAFASRAFEHISGPAWDSRRELLSLPATDNRSDQQAV
jgi:UbiD family decarboxylase